MKWLNFGGGHHITRPGYRLATLEQCITETQKKYGVQVYLEPGEAWALNAGYLVTTVLDTLQNGETSLAILDMSAACHTPDVIEMPYRPPLLDAGDPGGKAVPHPPWRPHLPCRGCGGRLQLCLPAHRGAKAHFRRYGHLHHLQEQTPSTGCRCRPSGQWTKNGTCRELVKFGYSDFKMRLGRAAD